MATSPKSAKPRKTTKSGTRRTASPETPVEDAVVIEETPADPAADPVEEPKTETPVEEAAPSETPDPAPSEPELKPVPVAKPERRRGGFGAFVGLVTGGILAAVIGFAAARYVVPDGWPFPGVPPEEDPMAAVVEAQGAAIASLGSNGEAYEAAISGLESADGTLRGEMQGQVAALQDQLSAATVRLDEINERLGSVERMAPEGSEAAARAAEAYARELETLRRMFDSELAAISEAQSDVTALEADAASSARAAAGRAALARVVAALDTGRAFDDALFDFTEATGIEAPAALTALATNGAPTLASLQESYPAAARAAIDASTSAAVADGTVSRWNAFLTTQLGTRSLEPREGDDADAVLSRAEGALRQGDVAAALAELAALPEAASPAMADWQNAAEARVAGMAAGAALADEMNAK